MTDSYGTMHEAPDLIGLLAGELRRDEAISAGRHLRTCGSCAHELADLAVAHAALRSSHRVSSVLSQQPSSELLESDSSGSPGQDSSDQDSSDQDSSDQDSGDQVSGTRVNAPVRSASDDDPLPLLVLPKGETGEDDLEEVPEARSAHASKYSKRLRFLSVAAVALVIAASASVITVVARHGSPSPIASAHLAPISAPANSSGTLSLYADGPTRSLVVETRYLPKPGPQAFYEVWLLDPSTQKMLPMGVLSPAGSGRYSVSAAIMNGYSSVDVSLQDNNGNPAHSKTSVLRAYL